MDLFASAGIDLPPGRRGRGRAGAPRSLRTPLFAHKVVEEAIGRAAALDDALIEAGREYARKLRGLKSAKETTFRPVFIDDVLIHILGYSRFDPDRPYTLADEQTLGAGAVDVALGRFEVAGDVKKVVAPFELKGPDTADLDRIMPGRGKTPVQQAWDYANDAPGAKWVLISNCREIRLYGYGRGREAYEVFDLARLDEPDELRRLWVILSAGNFLGEATERLLRDTDAAHKDITDRLYNEYNALRERLIAFLVGSADGPKLALGSAIEPAQKILDRILFIAFAQRRDLMRDGLLQRALKSQNEWSPVPVWQNFLGLFRYVDVGNFDMDIPPYNGGLFAHDRLVDSLVLPEPLAKDIAALGDWDYRREVPVTVLGHIFEQSITDIEKKRAEARGEEPPKVGKRKREGVVYTPDMVTRFLVEQTIGKTLDERRSALSAAHGLGGGDIPPDRELAFWRAWLESLRSLTIVDPACGSGAFLIAAFDRLAQDYEPVETCTEAARERFDILSAVRRRILDLAPPERRKLTGKLNDWHELDFALFRKEVKRAFRADIPVKERGQWEAYLNDNARRVRALTDRIALAEREIDRIVYALFGLTPDEIASSKPRSKASIEGVRGLDAGGARSRPPYGRGPGWGVAQSSKRVGLVARPQFC